LAVNKNEPSLLWQGLSSGCGWRTASPLSLLVWGQLFIITLPASLTIQYNKDHGNGQNSGGAALYYLTFTIVYWLPVFVSAEPCLIVTDSLNYCHQHKSLRINAFVIMPTHLHLIVFDEAFDNERLQHTVNAMRQFTGRQLANYCVEKMPAIFGQVISSPRRKDRTHQFWQQSKHPVAIWSESFWRTKVDYLHDNPRRKGLVQEATAWRFSSAGSWLLDPPEPCDVTLTGVAW